MRGVPPATHAPRRHLMDDTWLICPRVPSSKLFNDVTALFNDVTDFAKGLVAKLKDTIESLPTPQDLVNTAREKAEEWLNDKLCLVPPSGSGINSGKQMVVIGPANKNPALAKSDSLVVGVSRLNIATVSPITTGTIHTYRCLIEVACARARACAFACACARHLQVTTSANLCFSIYGFALSSSGLAEAMNDFWENNTVVEA